MIFYDVRRYRHRYVCADREFASAKWLKFLTGEKIPYRLRIKANHELTDKRG
jgi:hypothetical protein